MAINFCTLNSFTIDTFCGVRRGLIVDELIKKKYPVSLAGGGRALRQYSRPSENVLDNLPWTFDSPNIRVTVRMDDVAGDDIQSAAENNLFVLVKNIDLDGESPPVSVNISDFEMEDV